MLEEEARDLFDRRTGVIYPFCVRYFAAGHVRDIEPAGEI